MILVIPAPINIGLYKCHEMLPKLIGRNEILLEFANIVTFTEAHIEISEHFRVYFGYVANQCLEYPFVSKHSPFQYSYFTGR